MIDLVQGKWEPLADGFGATEGPLFSRRGYLLFSDLTNSRIMRWEAGKVSVFRENSNGSNGLTFDHQGRLLACERDRVTRTEKDGHITVLAKAEHPNDLVYAIDGSVYFSDRPAGIVYQVTRSGDVRKAATDCKQPNGVALAPNQQKLYVADNAQRCLRVYDVAGDGSLRNSRVFVEINGDGIKTDEEGNVWAASAGGIVVADRDGKQIGKVDLPQNPRNLNWGEGFRNLYITAGNGIGRLRTKVPGTRTY